MHSIKSIVPKKQKQKKLNVYEMYTIKSQSYMNTDLILTEYLKEMLMIIRAHITDICELQKSEVYKSHSQNNHYNNYFVLSMRNDNSY